jgi:protein ImuB
VALPNLSLDALRAGATADPAVAVEAQHGQVYVVAANRQARRYGIGPGCKLNAALALAASLQVFERSLSLERASLESLAAWSNALTPTVSIELPETLLLEVSGSLRLFHSLAALKLKLDEEIARRGWSRRVCAAPTALAALWLVRDGTGIDVSALGELTGRLSSLPLRVTRWPVEIQALLEDLGVRTLGDCLRLPRDGFARRVGEPYLHDLDRALGRRFDGRTPFALPERWKATCELYQESSDSAVFMSAIEHMLDGLVAELRGRQVQVRSLRVMFEHVQHPPTCESFDWVEPTHDRGRLLGLLRDRIERIVLPAPATGLGVSTGAFQPLQSRPTDLFDETPVETLAHVLLERLRGRLGSSAVYGMTPIAEHRPELAWARSDAGPCSAAAREGPLSPWARPRPLWLLPTPLPLSCSEACRYYEGTVELGTSPERIESGWWDERDVGRDYYTAVSSGGQRLWVFRDRRDLGWYLHGLFG